MAWRRRAFCVFNNFFVRGGGGGSPPSLLFFLVLKLLKVVTSLVCYVHSIPGGFVAENPCKLDGG